MKYVITDGLVDTLYVFLFRKHKIFTMNDYNSILIKLLKINMKKFKTLKCCDIHLAKLWLEKFLGCLYKNVENSGR